MKVMIPGAVSLLSTNVAGSSYPQWLAGTTYAVGAFVSSAGVSKGEYQALVANTDKDPELAINIYNATSNPTGVWNFIGTQNKWKCFDQYLNTQTINTSSITMTILAYGAQCLFLGNIDGYEVIVSVIDNDTSEVIEPAATFSIIDEPTTHEEYGYGDWLDYTSGNITYDRTTLTRNISFIVTVNAGISSIAKLGIFAAGSVRELGNTIWGLELSAIDYSTVLTDTASGATFLSKGNNAKLMNPTLISDTANITAYYKTLGIIQGQPVVFIGEKYEAFCVFGYLQKFKQSASNPKTTNTTLDIVGLI